ncbi:MAG: NAD(P)H-dependent oxidoreductase [Bdellovibrionaceae bacterium]|nr:NAD(P)H-dependent oxidoreductase [Pseudobdellovibrionaceae bacterium]
MIYIISGTDRLGSNSLILSKQLLQLYTLHNVTAEIIDLQSLPLQQLHGLSYNQDKIPENLKPVFDKIAKAKAFHIVCPEYNGSYPGILKLFMDYWQFPASLEGKLVAFVGLGGQFAGLRPVEHLTQVFLYRNSMIYPEKVFFFNVWNMIKDGALVDKSMLDRLQKQVEGFSKFIKLHV